MSNIVLRTIFLTITLVALGLPAMAQNQSKRSKPKRLSVKQQLALERQRGDSLQGVILRLGEQNKSLEAELKEANTPEEEYAPSEQLSIDYSPSEADALAEKLQIQQVDDALENFLQEYVAEPTTLSTDEALDSLYSARLKNMISPINLPYNSLVRTYIKRYTDSSGLMSRVLGLSKYYFPMIEEELILAGLPVELRAMAIIESALRATAVSRAGASGLWQFMPITARSYGLEVNTMVDERFDPYKSTKAACRYMKDLYNMYKDWSLAIAAYNCGPGNVNKALARAGGDPQSFWDIYWFLPAETRGYVPAFIAASYAYAYHQAHDIEYTEPPMPIAVDTVKVSRLMHLGQVSSTIDVDSLTLKMLNPQYKLDVIPATNKSYTLVLPANRVCEYVESEKAIFAKDSAYLKEYINPETVKKKVEATATYYVVKRGDTLGAIARRYRVTTKQLMAWNRLKSADKLSIGQRLRIERR